MSYEASSVQRRTRMAAWRPGEGDLAADAGAIPTPGVVRSGMARAHERRAIVRDVLQLHDTEAAADREADIAADAAGRTGRWLAERQAVDGHWRGPLEGDTILESEYLLILAWAGRTDDPHAPGACRRIVAEQLPAGGWAIYPGGPIDVSASVKAYLALKIFGHDPDSEPLARARAAIAAAGGPWAVNSFTKFYLALLGQMPYSACPAVPPEMVLLPSWFPVSLGRVSAWSRTMIVPLSLMWAFKPVRRLPPRQGIAELFSAEHCDRRLPPAAAGDWWARFFRGVDTFVKACESLGLRPLRSRAVMACRRWMLDRFSGSDGLGAIFPPIVWSIVALKSLGCDDDSPEVKECWRQLERLVEPQCDGTTRLEPCRSPVWDTAICVRALSDADLAAVAGARPSPEPDSPRVAAAVDWLLEREVRSAGDWAQSAGATAPSGWCFQYANRFYPDVDDTAMVVIALATWRTAVEVDEARRPDGGRRLARVDAALGRAVAWLEAMQNSDGGWGAFDRDNDCELLCKVPFADHNAMIDPSTPDLAGRVLEAFGKVGLRAGHPAVDRGIAYLRRAQRADGAWFGRWGVNYVYGTWQAIEGLRAVGLAADDPAVACGADWLVGHQQSCGGWGETCDSYADERLAGVGVPTASQTAWAVAGLVAADRAHGREARRGVQWLVSRQAEDGGWDEKEFTGTGFPKVFYLRYHYYPIYFPLMALARWSLARRTAVADDAARERVA